MTTKLSLSMGGWTEKDLRKIKMDYRLLNGKPRATLIQRFDGSAVLLGPKAKKFEFDCGTTLYEIQAKADQLGWVVAIEHLHKEREGGT